MIRAIPTDPNSCVFVWVLNTDLKGWINSTILEVAFVNMMFDYIKNLRKYITKLRQTGRILWLGLCTTTKPTKNKTQSLSTDVPTHEIHCGNIAAILPIKLSSQIFYRDILIFLFFVYSCFLVWFNEVIYMFTIYLYKYVYSIFLIWSSESMYFLNDF